jgi:hypothetical protein
MFHKISIFWTRSNAHFPLAIALGCIALCVTSWRYRVDQVSCGNWPPLESNLAYTGLCLVGMLLLSYGWIQIARMSGNQILGVGSNWVTSTKKVFGYAIILHGIMWLGLPFLSQDPAFYCALGRSMAVFHQSPYLPLNQALPTGDSYLAAVASEYHSLSTPYGPGFHVLAFFIGKIGGANIVFDFRLYQLAGMAAIFLSAWLVRAAVGHVARTGQHSIHQLQEQLLGDRAAALVLCCPLSLVEATLNAHNDSLLVLVTALFVFLLVRGRFFIGLISLAAGFFIKFSGALLLGFSGLVWILTSLKDRLNKTRILALAGLMLATALALAFFLMENASVLGSEVFKIIGNTSATEEHCARAIECLPRLVFIKVFDTPLAAWVTGICFRLAGLIWMIYAIARAVKTRRFLEWAGTFFFIYLLFFHSWSLTWYRLSLLPLLPFASKKVYPAMVWWVVTAMIYYALDTALTCNEDMIFRIASALLQGVFLIAIPTWILIRYKKSSLYPLGQERVLSTQKSQ